MMEAYFPFNSHHDTSSSYSRQQSQRGARAARFEFQPPDADVAKPPASLQQPGGLAVGQYLASSLQADRLRHDAASGYHHPMAPDFTGDHKSATGGSLSNYFLKAGPREAPPTGNTAATERHSLMMLASLAEAQGSAVDPSRPRGYEICPMHLTDPLPGGKDWPPGGDFGSRDLRSRSFREDWLVASAAASATMGATQAVGLPGSSRQREGLKASLSGSSDRMDGRRRSMDGGPGPSFYPIRSSFQEQLRVEEQQRIGCADLLQQLSALSPPHHHDAAIHGAGSHTFASGPRHAGSSSSSGSPTQCEDDICHHHEGYASGSRMESSWGDYESTGMPTLQSFEALDSDSFQGDPHVKLDAASDEYNEGDHHHPDHDDGDGDGSDHDGSSGTADAYSDDEFRMYEFKVRRCTRGRSHDWTECPFAHPGEKAKRRDPRKHSYSGTACPDYRKGSCRRGDACEFAHGVFEAWLHPDRYRTQPCKDGRACRRRVCFFAHTQEQLRLMPFAAAAAASAPGMDGGSRDALLQDVPEDEELTLFNLKQLPEDESLAARESLSGYHCHRDRDAAASGAGASTSSGASAMNGNGLSLRGGQRGASLDCTARAEQQRVQQHCYSEQHQWDTAYNANGSGMTELGTTTTSGGVGAGASASRSLTTSTSNSTSTFTSNSNFNSTSTSASASMGMMDRLVHSLPVDQSFPTSPGSQTLPSAISCKHPVPASSARRQLWELPSSDYYPSPPAPSATPSPSGLASLTSHSLVPTASTASLVLSASSLSAGSSFSPSPTLQSEVRFPPPSSISSPSAPASPVQTAGSKSTTSASFAGSGNHDHHDDLRASRLLARSMLASAPSSANASVAARSALQQAVSSQLTGSSTKEQRGGPAELQVLLQHQSQQQQQQTQYHHQQQKLQQQHQQQQQQQLHQQQHQQQQQQQQQQLHQQQHQQQQQLQQQQNQTQQHQMQQQQEQQMEQLHRQQVRGAGSVPGMSTAISDAYSVHFPTSTLPGYAIIRPQAYPLPPHAATGGVPPPSSAASTLPQHYLVYSMAMPGPDMPAVMISDHPGHVLAANATAVPPFQLHHVAAGGLPSPYPTHFLPVPASSLPANGRPVPEQYYTRGLHQQLEQQQQPEQQQQQQLHRQRQEQQERQQQQQQQQYQHIEQQQQQQQQQQRWQYEQHSNHQQQQQLQPSSGRRKSMDAGSQSPQSQHLIVQQSLPSTPSSGPSDHASMADSLSGMGNLSLESSGQSEGRYGQRQGKVMPAGGQQTPTSISQLPPPPALHPQGSAPLPSDFSYVPPHHSTRLFFSRSMPAGREAGIPQVQSLETTLSAQVESGKSSAALSPGSAAPSTHNEAAHFEATRTISGIQASQAHNRHHHQLLYGLQENAMRHANTLQVQQQRHPQQQQALSSIGRTASDRTDYGQASCCPDVGWVANLVDDE